MVDVDVIQVGFGPVGQVHAALLGAQGHSVAAFDKWPGTYPLSRAGHLDHEIMRILQGIGATDTFRLQAIPIPDYDWVNAAGELLLHIDWNAPTPSGWKSDYLFYQPEVEEAVLEAVGRHPSVSVELGWEAIGVTNHPDHVEVRLRELEKTAEGLTPTGAEKTVTARYLIGADGANSFVRRQVGIEWEDLGFEEDWLVTDIEPHDRDMVIDMPDAGQICDPARPVSLFRWLGRHTARWEFMLLDGEDPEVMAQDETIWSLLSRWGVDKSNATIVRKKVYGFRSLIASTFRRERTLLIGDSAHLMPPFMGQGLSSGIRDAVNLAWKLDLVLTGRAEDALLDAYTTERRPHARALIQTSMDLGKVVCMSDPDEVAARDAAFLAGEVPPAVFPWLYEGVLDGGESTEVVGRLGLQARVAIDGRDGLADDLLGTGWTLLSSRADYIDELSAEQRAIIDSLGMRHAHVSQAELETENSIVDVDADYSRWFTQVGAPIVIIRPDYYVFGLAKDSADLGGLLERLAAAAELTGASKDGAEAERDAVGAEA